MFKNYLITALRLLKKDRVYAIVNVLGLSLGLVMGFISLMYLNYELTYDQFHSKADQIYRIHQKFNDGGITARCSYPIGPALVDEYPQITKMVRMVEGQIRLRVEEKQFMDNIMIADSSFYDIFDLDFIVGSPADGLRQLNNVIITESLADRFFGDKDPLDEIIRIDALDDAPVIVKGVVKDFPPNSHFRFGILGNLKMAPFIQHFEDNPNWNNPIVHTYVLIPDKQAAQKFIDDRLEPFVAKFFPPEIGEGAWLPVMPLTKIHLESHEYYELGQNSTYTYLYGVGGVGILILLLACMNYMNLSAARALNRLKEIGVRKVIGAKKEDLIIQLLSEAVLLSIIASIIASLLIWLSLPTINSFAKLSLSFSPIESPISFLAILSFGLIVGIITGLYPAFFLSSFPALSIMHNQLGTGIKQSVVRSILVTGQLVVVGFFFLCIYTIGSQLRFISKKELGFDRERVAFIRNSDSMSENDSYAETYKRNLENHPNILSVTRCWGLPGGTFTNYSHNKVHYEGMPEEEVVGIGLMTGDDRFIETMGLKLIHGRNLDGSIASDSLRLLVNETLIKQFGWENEGAIGKEIDFEFMTSTVAGVVKDFHFESLHQPIKPMAIRLSPDGYWAFGIKIGKGDLQQTMNFVRDEWRKFDDGWPNDLVLIEDGIQSQYQAEEKILTIFNYLTYIAVFLAAVGLLSNIAFYAQRKVKEIGIRKVLGASMPQIFAILSKETLIQIGVALLISFPLAYFFLSNWLSSFAYRIELHPGLFLATGVTILGIALLTISFTVYRAASANPVDAIKME